MTISLIAAMAKGRVIGNFGTLPWHLPADLKFFKQTTMGKPIIMGRITWESIGKPLPGRRNIVVTRKGLEPEDGAESYPSLDAALDAIRDEPEVMIIGGASIYQQAISQADRLYLTLIDAEIEGDVWFPEYDEEGWKEISREEHEADEKNAYPYAFVVLEKR